MNNHTDPERKSLSAVFKRGSIVHVVVDIQDMYCDPSHAFPVEFGYDHRGHERAASRIRQFIGLTRAHIQPLWVVDGQEFMGRDEASGKYYANFDQIDNLEHWSEQLYLQEPAADDRIFPKRRSDEYPSALKSWIAAAQPETVIVSGVILPYCVQDMANALFAQGLNVVVMEDLVADGDVPSDQIRNFINARPQWHRLRSDQVLDRLEI